MILGTLNAAPLNSVEVNRGYPLAKSTGEFSSVQHVTGGLVSGAGHAAAGTFFTGHNFSSNLDEHN